MKKVVEFLRIKEWFVSKCAFLIAIALSGFIKDMTGQESIGEIYNFLAFIIFITFFLAFGYVINDFSDREVDKKAGKKKIIASMPVYQCVIIIFLMLIVAVIPLICLNPGNQLLIITMAATILLGLSYSAKPFRFKERGVCGLIISSVAQRCMPIFVLYAIVPMKLQELWKWTGISFFIGLRYILIHQRIDLENDLKTGTHTFVNHHTKSADFGIYLSFFMELVILFALFRPWQSRWIAVSLIVYAGYAMLQIISVKKRLLENAFLTFSCVPLEDLYNFYIPVFFFFKMIKVNPLFLPLFVLFLAVAGKVVRDKIILMLGYILAYKTK